MRIENLFDSLLQMRMIFIKPISTKDSENKMLIACIARTSSVAFGSMYELQRQILGTKKCQIPNPIVTMLAIAVRIRMSIAYLIDRESGVLCADGRPILFGVSYARETNCRSSPRRTLPIVVANAYSPQKSRASS